MKKLNTDLLGGLIMLACAVFFYVQMDEEFTHYAAYFPDRIIPCLAVLGAALLVKARLKPTMLDSFVSQMNSTMLFAIFVGLAWVLTLEWVGFIISSFAAIFAMLVRFLPPDKRGTAAFAKLALLAAVEVGGIYVLFVKFLYVTLPVGRLFA